MAALSALQYAVIALFLLIVTRNWRALAMRSSEGRQERFRGRDLLPAVATAAAMLILLGVTSLLASRREGESVLWQALPIAGLVVGGGLCGRWGGRYGLAALLWTLFGLIAFIPFCALVSMTVFAAKPELGRLYVDATLSQWWETLLPNAPLMIFLSLAAARVGDLPSQKRRSASPAPGDP